MLDADSPRLRFNKRQQRNEREKMSDEPSFIDKYHYAITYVLSFIGVLLLGWKFYLSDMLSEFASMLSRIKVLEDKIVSHESIESACKQLQDQRHEQHELKIVAMQNSINNVGKEVKASIDSVGKRVDQILLKMVDK